MFFSFNLEAGFDKRFSVLFQRCNIALFFPYPAKPILKIAPKEREAIVHIYNHTDATRREQIEDVSHTIKLITGIVTVSDSIDAKDEIKNALQLQSLFFQSNRKIGQQALIPCLVKFQSLKPTSRFGQ